MSGNDRKGGVTFLWAIENFDENFRGNLVSPVFLSNSLNDTEWQISVCPSNDDDYFSLTLTRCGSDDKGIARIILDCELTIVDKLGSSLECMEIKNHGFVRFHSWSRLKFVSRSVFVSKKSEILHSSILTVRCRMWRRLGENTQAELRCCRSRIEKSCFIWSITDFCRLKAFQRKKMHVKRVHSEIPILIFEFFFKAGNEEAIIEISPSAELSVFQFWCAISALDGIGKLITKEGDDTFVCRMSDWNVFNKPHEQWTFHITRSTLVKNKRLFLPMDVLSLRVETYFWTNETKNLDERQYSSVLNFQVSEQLLSTQKSDDQCKVENLSRTKMCDKQCMTESLPNTQKYDTQSTTEAEISKTDFPTASKLSNISGMEILNEELELLSQKFFQDMQSIFEEGFLSDFSLCTDNKTFRVHKTILSARSPVFRAMFTTAMKEMEGNKIEIPDVDADTLQRMLLFMYSNKMEDLNWESAMNLYFAADKYDIDDLKQATCSSLKSGLSVSNACEILVHADLHEDRDLKSTALEFIMSNDKEIIGTKDWKIFQRKHINLAVEILSDLYTKKMKN